MAPYSDYGFLFHKIGGFREDWCNDYYTSHYAKDAATILPVILLPKSCGASLVTIHWSFWALLHRPQILYTSGEMSKWRLLESKIVSQWLKIYFKSIVITNQVVK